MPTSRPFLRALRDTAGVGVALVPLGIAFGLLVVQAGLAWWWAPLFSVLIYAGSLEFLAIGLIVAMTPLAQIALATVLVNFRHVFYALSFPLQAVRGRAAKTYSMYALTDEAYALAHHVPAAERTTARILWLQLLCQGYWVLGGVLGALLGTALPSIPRGMDFALTALFAVLTIDAFRVTRDVPSPILALLSALVALVVAPDQMLVVAMGVFVAALTVRFTLSRRAGLTGQTEQAGVTGHAEPAEQAGLTGRAEPAEQTGQAEQAEQAEQAGQPVRVSAPGGTAEEGTRA